MGFSPLHVCMDSSSSDHWLQGTVHQESGMDSSSSPSGEMLTCSRPLMERRLRPPHDQALKCPRCDSTHTKFCYYNNYSLSQPRYFCKTCRRYWTKGGTLRNIPVGGGCRKNKKVSSKKSNDPSPNTQSQTQLGEPSYHHHNPKDLQSSFLADMQFSHLSNFLGPNGALGNPSFGMLENPRPIDFMESKLEGIIGTSRNFDFMGNSDMGSITVGLGDHINGQNVLAPNFQGFYSSAFGGMSLDGGYQSGTNYMMDSSCQRLMLPYDHANENDQRTPIDVKPNPKLLSIEWQDHQSWSTDDGKESFSYVSGLGSCSGMMNGYGPSAANPLV